MVPLIELRIRGVCPRPEASRIYHKTGLHNYMDMANRQWLHIQSVGKLHT